MKAAAIEAREATFRAAFAYEAQPREFVGVCNLCGEFGALALLRTPDRYGFPVSVEFCWCGLNFINPRMTVEAYRQFYESGAYRRLVSAYHGREINAETLRPEQELYAAILASFLKPHMRPEYRTLLDVGGSTGVVAGMLAQFLRLKHVSLIEPSAAEIAEAASFAPSYTLTAHRTTIEAFEPGRSQWNLITLCQTIDHLLDPMGVLRKLHGCLSEKGLLFVDAVDYNVTRQIKIDHPYNFTEATMAEMLKRAGFREVARERAPDGVHVRFLCRRAE